MTEYQLDAEKIFRSAARHQHLESYASEDLLSRFSEFIRRFNDLGSIQASQLAAANAQLEKLVANRLKLARDWQQHPEILEEKIVQPFFVIGNARSGTTVAQCLLAEDAGHRMPLYWESRHPSPPPGLDPASDAASIEGENQHVASIIKSAPDILKIHPFMEHGAFAEAECEDLYANDFHIHHILHFTKVPNVPQFVPPANPLLAFSFHKKLLQQFQWKTPTGRWVCKGPAHQFNLPSLLQVYPDAECFWMHRRPDEYLVSMLEMLEIIYRPTNGDLYHVDPQQLVAGLRAGFDYILQLDCIDDPRIHHVNFHHFIKNPVSVIGACYEKAGIEFSQSFQQNIRRWLDNPNHRSDRYGKLTYDESKYGLSKKQIQQLFADYYERFGLYD